MAKAWSWPFRAKTAEQKSTSGLVALAHPGAAHWGGRDAAALTRDGYLRNAVAYRCVRMVAEAAASIGLVTEHVGAAKILAMPQPGEAGAAFFERLYSDLQLTGNAYIEAVRLPGERGVAGLYPLRPSRVQAVLDGRGWVDGYSVKAGREARIVRRDEGGWCPVFHAKLHHPDDDVYGLPALAAARRALDLHNATADWAKALIDNSAKPSGALVFSGGQNLTPDQFDRLKDELERQYSGAANAGRPLLLEGGLDWRAMSLSPAEMDFREARNGAAREIALALGVPPMLLGIPGDNTYSNYKEANLAFWRMTVLPLVRRMSGALGLWLGEAFGEEVSLSLDLDRVSALSAERDALWARLEAASFATEDEKRSLAGLDR
ncbi:MAG: phage portal protein [Hyphomonas sp.]